MSYNYLSQDAEQNIRQIESFTRLIKNVMIKNNYTKDITVKYFISKMNYFKSYLFTFIFYFNRISNERLLRISRLQKLEKYIYNYNYNYQIMLISLNEHKIKKLQFMKNEFEKCMKYCDYAEEQCIVQEKMLLSILQMNTYSDELNIIVETIIMNPIQKYIYCISTDIILQYLNLT